MDVRHRFKPETTDGAVPFVHWPFECAFCGLPRRGKVTFRRTADQGGEIIATQVSPEPACNGHDGVRVPPKWTDLIGICPDYTGGMDVGQFLEESRGEA